MLTLRSAIVTAALAAGLVTACGGSSPSSPSSAPTQATPSARPGIPFSTTRFSTVVPTGWDDKSGDQTETAKFSTSGQVLYLAEQGPPGTQQKDVNDVKANINVIALTTPVSDDQVAAYLSSVITHGATNLSAPQPFTIDGATGQYTKYNQDVSGTPGESQDMVINHAGTTYNIVLNTSQFAFAQQLSGLQGVLAAWKWAP